MFIKHVQNFSLKRVHYVLFEEFDKISINNRRDSCLLTQIFPQGKIFNLYAHYGPKHKILSLSPKKMQRTCFMGVYKYSSLVICWRIQNVLLH